MTAMPAKAIIVAAGRGRRLGDRTDELPKCMVRVGGRPILHWQLDALAGAGVRDVLIVRGYRGTLIDGGLHPLRFAENPGWETNNILASLLHARDDLAGGFFFSYSDIVYGPSVARRLAAAVETSPDDGCHLIVDRAWQGTYEGRTLHPLPEAELARVDGRGADARITQVGKLAVPADEAAGEFIGLAYISGSAATALLGIWDAAIAKGGLEAPFGRARALRHAYLTDALNALEVAGHALRPVFIDGSWREIDTGQDLERAEDLVATWI